MTTPAQIIQLGPGQGPAFSAVGDVYRILATGEQTGGAYVLSEAQGGSVATDILAAIRERRTQNAACLARPDRIHSSHEYDFGQ